MPGFQHFILNALIIQYFVILGFNYPGTSYGVVDMKIGNKYYQSIWLDESDPEIVRAINQQKLPFVLEELELRSVEDVYSSIKDMAIRGASLIGATGAFGMYLATLEITALTNVREHLQNAARYLISSRPTAVNLSWAINEVLNKLSGITSSEQISETALSAANEICEMEKNKCRQIGVHGVKLIEEISRKNPEKPVNILTHCNAGWLACVDYGTALAPVYLAKEKGIQVHVWVDETRPQNQGAKLTAFELGNVGVPYTLIPDNAGGHLMQHGMVDIVIVGSDRTTRTGDVANKIGTYLKALAAYDNNIPFYAALPSSSIDFSISDGLSEIPIEERDPEEVTNVYGFTNGKIIPVLICPEGSAAANYGFDVTPAHLVTGLITEKGYAGRQKKILKNCFQIKSIKMDGAVKFNCHWNQSGPVISDEQYEIINYWREVLFNMDLIGAYENGVGFGNISMRAGPGNQFIITGSATGEIPELEPDIILKSILLISRRIQFSVPAR